MSSIGLKENFIARNGVIGKPPAKTPFKLSTDHRILMAMVSALSVNLFLGNILGKAGEGAVFALFGAWALGLLAFRATTTERVLLERIYGPTPPKPVLAISAPSKWQHDYEAALATLDEDWVDTGAIREFERQLCQK